MAQLLRRRHLEAVDLHPLGVDAAHDVTDGPVLASGVDPLQADENGVGVLGGEPGLVISEQLHALLEEGLAGFLFQEVGRVAGVEVLCKPYR